MSDTRISVNIVIKKHYICPANTATEELVRKRYQDRLNFLSYELEHAMKNLIEAINE